jgi:hypothetical protein
MRGEERRRRAMLMKKGAGKEAKLCYSANALTENRNGLLIEFAVEPADGCAERNSARAMLETALPGGRRITLRADKGCDTRDFVESCRALKVTLPHRAQRGSRRRLGARPPHRASCWLRGEPKSAQAARGDLRLDEDRGRPAQNPLSRPRPHPAPRLSGGRRL